MTTLHCDHCSDEFTAKTSWARFCSLRCRNAWWRHQFKLREAEADLAAQKQLPELRKKFDVGMQIVDALKSANAQRAQTRSME
jgi:hypothetical protein